MHLMVRSNNVLASIPLHTRAKLLHVCSSPFEYEVGFRMSLVSSLRARWLCFSNLYKMSRLSCSNSSLSLLLLVFSPLLCLPVSLIEANFDLAYPSFAKVFPSSSRRLSGKRSSIVGEHSLAFSSFEFLSPRVSTVANLSLLLPSLTE